MIKISGVLYRHECNTEDESLIKIDFEWFRKLIESSMKRLHKEGIGEYKLKFNTVYKNKKLSYIEMEGKIFNSKPSIKDYKNLVFEFKGFNPGLVGIDNQYCNQIEDWINDCKNQNYWINDNSER